MCCSASDEMWKNTCTYVYTLFVAVFHGVLQCVNTLWKNVFTYVYMQCVAVFRSVLQGVCGVSNDMPKSAFTNVYMQCIAVFDKVAVCCSVSIEIPKKLTHTCVYSVLQYVVVCRSVLQCVAACQTKCRWKPAHALICSVLQCVAIYHSVLQCVAVCCSALNEMLEEACTYVYM